MISERISGILYVGEYSRLLFGGCPRNVRPLDQPGFIADTIRFLYLRNDINTPG